MTKEQYNKTWYYKWTLPSTKSPDNWITGTPIKLFGRFVAVRWKIAKANYPWRR
jgi:hypothetical protein